MNLKGRSTKNILKAPMLKEERSKSKLQAEDREIMEPKAEDLKLSNQGGTKELSAHQEFSAHCRFRPIPEEDQDREQKEANTNALKKQMEEWTERMYDLADSESFNAPAKQYEQKKKILKKCNKDISDNEESSNPFQSKNHIGAISRKSILEEAATEDPSSMPSSKRLIKPKKRVKAPISKNFIRLTLKHNVEVQNDQPSEEERLIDHLRKAKAEEEKMRLVAQSQLEKVNQNQQSFDEDGTTFPIKRRVPPKYTLVLKPWVSLKSPDCSSSKKPSDRSFKPLKLKPGKKQFFDLDCVKVEAETLENEELLSMAEKNVPSSLSRMSLVRKLNESRIHSNDRKENSREHEEQLQTFIAQRFKKDAKDVILRRQRSAAQEFQGQSKEQDLQSESTLHPTQRLDSENQLFISRKIPMKKSGFLPFIALNPREKSQDGENLTQNHMSALNSPKKGLASTLDRSSSLIRNNCSTNTLESSHLSQKRKQGYFLSYEKKKLKQSLSGILGPS